MHIDPVTSLYKLDQHGNHRIWCMVSVENIHYIVYGMPTHSLFVKKQRIPSKVWTKTYNKIATGYTEVKYRDLLKTWPAIKGMIEMNFLVGKLAGNE